MDSNDIQNIKDGFMSGFDKGFNFGFEQGWNKALNSQQDCKGGQTISVNVGSLRNPLQGKVLASSETSSYGLQETLEQSDYKTGSNMETTGDVRLKSPEVVSLLSDGTPRSSKSPADNLHNEIEEAYFKDNKKCVKQQKPYSLDGLKEQEKKNG